MILCPICRGEGKVEKIIKDKKHEENIRIAKALRITGGLSIRRIMKLMGYASPRSVQMLLKKESPVFNIK